MNTGSVTVAQRSGRPSTSHSTENVTVVQQMFSLSPQKSTREASRESGLSRHTVRRPTVLREDLGFRPWKPHAVQELKPEDCDRRLEFGETMLMWLEQTPDMLKNNLWSDEAIFHVEGMVNRHNCHYWAAQDPRVTFEKAQGQPKVTV